MPPAFSDSRNTGTSPAWKRATIASRSATGVPPCRNWCGTPVRARCCSSSRPIATYWVNTSTAPSSASTVSTSSSSSSSFSERPASRTAPDCLRKWAGWLQICLRPVSSVSTSPRRVSSSARSIRSIVSRTNAS